jgi:hypothetical protein
LLIQSPESVLFFPSFTITDSHLPHSLLIIIGEKFRSPSSAPLHPPASSPSFTCAYHSFAEFDFHPHPVFRGAKMMSAPLITCVCFVPSVNVPAYFSPFQ